MQGIIFKLSEVKFFKAIILEDQEYLKLSYNQYVDNFQLFPKSKSYKVAN